MAVTNEEVRVIIKSDDDVLSARQESRELGVRLGFRAPALAAIATAISELARNLLLYARNGSIVCWAIDRENQKGIVIQATDEGPGIPDIEAAMKDGYSTSGGLGLGLPGVRRMMDEFSVVSRVGHGTIVTAIKWTD